MITSVQSAKDFLYSFANYEVKMPHVYNTNKFNLLQFTQFLDFLGNPHKRFPLIHIAGTKGKGSTAAMLASIFKESGYRTGLFHSPHLRDTRERIQMDGAWIPEREFIELCNLLSNKSEKFGNFDNNYRTTFELLTALAFLYFQRSEVDIAVIETGLGGRLDCTNVVEPLISIITRIGKDHVVLLGNSIKAISEEKGGIIKKIFCRLN